MSEDRDHTIATATVTSEEMPYGVRIDAEGHALRGDEPAGHGGAGSGPAPFGLLLAGLGACTAITLRMYAERKGWPLAGVDVTLTYVVKDKNTRWTGGLITLHGVDEDQRAACGIPYWVTGDIDEPERLTARSPEAHRRNGIDLRMRTEVKEIDLAAGR